MQNLRENEKECRFKNKKVHVPLKKKECSKKKLRNRYTTQKWQYVGAEDDYDFL